MLYFSGFNYNIKYQEFTTRDRCELAAQFIKDVAKARELRAPAVVCVLK